ncbi:hypothetical protein [Streptomyces sp. GESEQ-35]|uniref:hypothetical protein n=1 Tax=Streptomyces sp. GESEQ-35 TaxID=2812657 RepID=UPI001FF18ACE|nr:hypothetical protein [Streptomyces sp. GESEQ-35]
MEGTGCDADTAGTDARRTTANSSGTRAAAEEVIHEVFLEIHAGRSQLLSAGHLEQGTPFSGLESLSPALAKNADAFCR